MYMGSMNTILNLLYDTQYVTSVLQGLLQHI